jgi:hypothetical protein
MSHLLASLASMAHLDPARLTTEKLPNLSEPVGAARLSLKWRLRAAELCLKIMSEDSVRDKIASVQSEASRRHAEVDEVTETELADICLAEMGEASELTRGSGGRHGEASYTRP